jgi:IS5 family transposase
MEETLHEIALYREFARLDVGITRLPDESTILRFRHLLEAHDLGAQILEAVNAQLQRQGLLLKTGAVVDATLIAAPSSTKNAKGERDPEMHQTKKGNQWHFGMKAHIGVDAHSGLVHTVVGTSANAHDVTQASSLLHGEESDVFADSGYRGVHKREKVMEDHAQVHWHVAMMPSHRKALDNDTPIGAIMDALEKTKARIRDKVDAAFRESGVCSLSQSRRAAFIRLCQRGPWDLKAARMSASRRMPVCTLVTAALGRPRRTSCSP